MSMTKNRVAQIIAASIGPDGKPNRAKIFDELSLSPDAPEVILIDAFFAADESFRALKDEQTKGLAGFKTVLDSELQQLVRAFAAHKLALAAAKTELEGAFMLHQEKLNASAKEIMDHSKASAAATTAVTLAAPGYSRPDAIGRNRFSGCSRSLSTSARSLMTTTSMSGSLTALRRTRRPMRPKPLMAMRRVMSRPPFEKN